LAFLISYVVFMTLKRCNILWQTSCRILYKFEGCHDSASSHYIADAATYARLSVECGSLQRSTRIAIQSTKRNKRSHFLLPRFRDDFLQHNLFSSIISRVVLWCDLVSDALLGKQC